MHLTARRIGIALVGLVAASGRAAAARPSDAEADAYAAALTRAIAAKERALDVNEPPRWEEALRLFQEAASLRYTRECTYEIGVAAEHLSRTDLAVEGYEAAIDLGLVGPPRARAQAFVAAHAAGMARLTVRGPAGRVVLVAGVRRGRLPLQRPIVLFPGEVRLDVFDQTGVATSIAVRLRGGQVDVLDLEKQALVTKPPAPEKEVAPAPAVVPRPAAEADTELLPPPPAPVPGESAKPDPRPSATPDERPEAQVSSRGIWIAGIGAVVTIAAVVLWRVGGSQIESDRAALPDKCDTPVKDDACTAKVGEGPAVQSLVDSIATWKGIQTGSKVGIGVGLVAVVGGLLLRYRDGAAATAPAASGASLVLDTRGGSPRPGLAWTLRF